MATKTQPNRTASHQVNLRLTDAQLHLIQQACQKAATSYGQPSVSRFILVEALAAAERMTASKRKD